jgi:hypothetical protein
MYLQSWDSIRDGKDDDGDEDTDDDFRKDGGFGRTKIDILQVNSQLFWLPKYKTI